MRNVGLAVVVSLLSGFAALANPPVHVNGYEKKDGTYVEPHERTAPNRTKDDNWSTKGNENPNTGKEGTKEGDAPKEE